MKRFTSLGLVALLSVANTGKLGIPELHPHGMVEESLPEEIQKAKWTPESVPRKVSTEEILEMPLEEAAETINRVYGYNLTAKDLIYLSRLLYFEAGSDPKTIVDRKYSEEKVKEGYQGIMNVIKNRNDFDLSQGRFTRFNCTHEKRFGDGTLISVVIDHKREWNAIEDNKFYFSNWSLDKALNDGDVMTPQRLKLKDAVNQKQRQEVSERVNWAYEVVIGVLNQDLEDNTNGAITYRTTVTPWGSDLVGMQGRTGFQYCGDLTGIDPDDKLKCRVNATYNLNSDEIIINSHSFRWMDSNRTNIRWVNGKKETEKVYIAG
ncbi:MAG: hypothetical protein ABIJ18_04820 [archaeon]